MAKMRISPELKKLIEKYRCVKDTEGMSPAKVYKLVGENETLVLLREENKEKLKRNAAIKNLLKFFFNRAENIEDKEKRLEAIGKNDRPMQPEEFNCCMETAQLNFEMIKEGKSFIIRRK